MSAESTIESLQEKIRNLEKQLEASTLSQPAEEKQSSGRVQTRLTKSAGKQISSDQGHLGASLNVKENPEFLDERLKIFDKLYAEYEADLNSKDKVPIKITLPDGSIHDGKAWDTSPHDVAMSIAEGLAKASVIAKVFYSNRLSAPETLGGQMDELEEDAVVSTGELWDMARPLEGDCKLQLLKFDDPEAKTVFWHSAAHLTGEALECKLGAYLTVGPPIDPGFYYDSFVGEHGIDDKCLQTLQKLAMKTAKSKQKFQRLVLSKDQALQMFAYNPYKTAIIRNKVKDGEKTCVYRNGPFIDLCLGPHIQDTGAIKAVELKQATTALWLGSDQNDKLQRVHGIAFPDKKLLKEHKALMKKAEENDHRKRGTEQELFFFDPMSPGCCFWKPHGAKIFNKLVTWIQRENRAAGYQEVITPNVFSADLWKKSGHWEHYQKNMFTFTDGESDQSIFGLKPMNCPGHCLIFDNQVRSYRELPIRFSDLGVLHRNEASGALSGLTRVRRFQQDDGHIFCRQDQVQVEVLNALKMVKKVYDTLGLTIQAERSTRPAKASGLVKENGEVDEEGVKMWDTAEEQLAQALDTFLGKGNWKDNPGDGAFYGPKVDIKVFDALKRKHQCATIQLDFQMPLRFNLKYSSENTKEGASNQERPVIIHRAVLGSVERMTAILTEHFGGKWPFFLSPRQVMVIPVHAQVNDYAEEIKQNLFAVGLDAEVDLSSKTLNKKILLAQKEQFNFMFVVGEKEKEEGTVNIRTRRNKKLGEMKLDEVIIMLQKYEAEQLLDDIIDPVDSA